MTKSLTINNVNVNLIIQIKKYCIDQDITLKQFVLEALTKHLEEKNKTKRKQNEK